MKFSLIIPVFDRLIPMLKATLEAAVSQKDAELEIVLIQARQNLQIDQLLEQFNVQKIRARQARMDAVIQQGLDCAMGDYVHILCPGEYYLSNFCLSALAGFIEEHDRPPVIMCGRLHQSKVFFDLLHKTDLSQGIYPQSLQNYVMRRNVFADLGGYDAKYMYKGQFDFFSRLALNKVAITCFKRALTDGHQHAKQALPRLEGGKEMLNILYKRFGWWAAIRWWLTRNQINFFQDVCLALKKAFLPRAQS